MFDHTIDKIVATLATAAFAALLCAAEAEALSTEPYSPCGPLDGGWYGPLDYRTATAAEKQLVEGTHFTKDVENLVKGATGPLAADIDYTLRAFPNNPRALLSMSKLGLRQKTQTLPGAKWTVDCYFERAIRWRPDDSLVRLVFGIHLTRLGRKDLARGQLEIAEQHPIDKASFYYNLGLAFLDIDDPDRALPLAWRAYELGYDLPGLRKRLEKLGKWRDPEK